jgi:hypothetical protein
MVTGLHTSVDEIADSAHRIRLLSTGFSGRRAQLALSKPAMMHGASFSGDGTAQLRGLSDANAAPAE